MGTSSATAPLVIAHRGACGYRPEHTREAFGLAIEQAADAIEIDVVASRDGHLVLRHEPELSGTTDIATRAEFASRRTVKDVDGRAVRGWFAEDFTWGELATLRTRERLPRLRPGGAAYDGHGHLLRLTDALEMTERAGIRLVIELKHAERSARLNLPLDDLLLPELEAARALPAITVESFEQGVLRRLAGNGFPHPLVYLLGEGRAAVDAPVERGKRLSYRDELRDLGRFGGLSGISVRTGLLDPGLVSRAATAGLGVWIWTLRPENRFLPPAYWNPGGPARFGRYASYWRSITAAGVTGVFADHPDLAHAALAPAPTVGAGA